MRKNENIYTLPQIAVEALSSGEWSQFLRSAAWNFRFPFQSQMLIYAQRPDATACYPFEDWNQRFSRRIKRGAKGIVLLDDTKDQLSLNYVFDYSDTYSRTGEKLSHWEFSNEKEAVIREALASEFLPDVPDTDQVGLYQFFWGISASLLAEELETAIPDLLDVRENCRLQELDSNAVEQAFCTLVINSATAMLMHRCGLDPANEMPENAFADAELFNSFEAMSVLGNTTQHVSKQILREIALTVAKWDKEHKIEEEIENEISHNISSGRGISGSELDTSETAGIEQVRENEESVPEREPSEQIHGVADIRTIDGTSSSDRADDSGADVSRDEGTLEEEPASGKSEGEPTLDSTHGEPSSTGGGNDLSGDDLQLNYYFDEAQITRALLRGSRVEGGKFRIQKAVEDEVSDFAGKLRDEYGTGGGSIRFSDETEGFIDYDSKGIDLRAPGYEPLHLTWKQVATRVKELVNSDKYLDDVEKVQMGRYFEAQEALIKRQEIGETLKIFFNIHRDLMPERTVHEVAELVRAFVYENSETATNELISIFREFGTYEEIQENVDVFTVLAQTFTSLLDVAGMTVDQLVPSAKDAGIENPFPTEDELDRLEFLREKPLAREPITEETDAERNYRFVQEYAPYILDGTLDYVRFESDAYEPLYIERIAHNQIAIAHTYIQEGDVMLDPEITFLVDKDAKTLRPLTYEQSDMGFYKRVYDYDDLDYLHPDEGKEKTINAFFNDWYQNLKWQRHEPVLGIKYTNENEVEFVFENGEPVPKELVPEVSEHIPEPSESLNSFSEFFNRLHSEVGEKTMALFPVGDFYEVYGPDAEQLASSLDLTLTQKTIEGETYSLCGFPKFKLEQNIEELKDYNQYVVLVDENRTSYNFFPPVPEQDKLQIGDVFELDGERFRITKFEVTDLGSWQDNYVYYQSVDNPEKVDFDVYGYIAVLLKQTRNRNQEPLIDHPELVTDRHFPKAREDKDLLSDLMSFVGDYRVTFKLQMPELSEHDREAYDIASEYIGNFVVTDEIYVNADLVRNLVSYINTWFVPFSEGVKPEITDKLDSLLERVNSFDADALYNAEQQKEAEAKREEAREQKVDNEEELAPDLLDSEVSEVSESEGEGKYNESSFHIGDLYEDQNGRGIITRVYIPDAGVPHESSFGYVDPDAPEDSRDAKGYVMSMDAAIRRLNRGEATLTPGNERAPETEASEEPQEPTLFDFMNDSEGSSDPFAPVSEPVSEPVPVQQAENDVPQVEKINFKFPDTVPSLGGPKARFKSNVEAIRLLKKLEDEGRLATRDEQEVLAKYVGWGGIQEAFDPTKDAWTNEYNELKELLTEDEYDAARESVMTAFYTPPEVSDAVFQVLDNLGFKRGNVLDPGCGIGSFSGRLPENMQESKVYGVEQDSISGRIAQQLYQKNNIIIDGYENTSLPDNFFDVAVGNVPFGAFKVRDKQYDKLNLQIHDYFFAKTLDKVRPGGVIAFVTSMGTMDKQNGDFRRYLSQRADLLGAIRLPNNTFKTNAGTTKPTSDIIFLQKREFPRIEEAYWVDLDSIYDYKKQEWGPEVNAYFEQNRDMILGEMTEISGPRGPEAACVAREGEDLREALKRAADKISGDYIQAERGLYDQEFDNSERIPADPNVRNYSFTIVNDEVYFREDSEMYMPSLNKTAEQRVRGLIGLRERVRNLIDAQMEGYSDEAIENLQKLLNDDYDAFTKKYGLINSRGNEMAFSDDSSYYLLCSLEHINDKGEFLGKADMFYKRTIRAHEKVERVDTAEEALAVSLGERGRIDFDFMAELSGLDKDKLVAQLQGHIFQDPTRPGVYELSATYLSGNVRRKLAQAQAAEEEEPGMWTANVRALEGVQPQELEPGDIAVRLGSTWVPKEDYTQFMHELLEPNRWYREQMEVLYSPYTNVFNIKNVNWDDNNTKANTTYGTRRMSAYKIIEHSLNLKDVKIYDTVTDPDGKERRVLNQNDTLEAQEKQQMIKDAFKEWIWQDPDRAERLCKAYNERFNSYVPPKYDGDLVQFHNLNPNVSMRPWQKEAVARIMYSGNTLLAHAVGAGKTWTMSAAAMEMKHLGLCNKSMIVVPNHLVGQWASAIYDQYPNAKVLASTKKDFETKNRKKFCSRIATGDYDVVIIGHSQFERIPLSAERQEAGVRAEIAKIVDAIAEMKADKAEHFTIKQMERMKKSLEARLDKLHNSKKRDNVINFEELGIDRLFVDESHEYKNLFLYTKMTNVAGISQTDSQKASDMFLKCRYIDEITGNKGNVHATGTPLSNTMAELYATQRYLQYDLLEDMGLETFDQWASTFGETVTSVELAPEGTGYRARTRFANFFNIPELMSLYCQCADIKTQDMLDLPLPTPHYENTVVPASDIQKDYVKGLGERAQSIRTGGVDPSKDNMLKITSDGRKLALDQRLIDSEWPDNPDSKVNACADNIYRIWQESTPTKGTQLVFCDISTPNNKTFNVYDDLKEKLIARGIPEDEIRFVHEANTDVQKEALFQKVRDGEVRVLMGSTGKMGTGTNVQERLVAGHDLDCPWRPSDLEQRAGRVIRQGNTNDDVYMYRYVTEGTFDAYMYQLVENKQRFISQIYTSKPVARQAADVDEIVMSFAEIKALASGNPLIKERVELEADIQRLQLLQSRHENAQHRLNRRITKELPEAIAREEVKIRDLEKDCALVESQPSRTSDGNLIPAEVKGQIYEKVSESGAAILAAVKRAPHDEVTVIGKLRGFTILVDKTERSYDGAIVPQLKLSGVSSRKYSVSASDNDIGTITRLNNVLDHYLPIYLKDSRENLSDYERELEGAKSEVGKPFMKSDELKEKQVRLEEVSRQLDLNAREDNEPSASEHISEDGRKPSLDSVIRSASVRQAEQETQPMFDPEKSIIQ